GDLNTVLEDARNRQERHDVDDPCRRQSWPAAARDDRERSDRRGEQAGDQVRGARKQHRKRELVDRRQVEWHESLAPIEDQPIAADGQAVEQSENGHRSEVPGVLGGRERDRNYCQARKDERSLFSQSSSRIAGQPSPSGGAESPKRKYVQDDENAGERQHNRLREKAKHEGTEGDPIPRSAPDGDGPRIPR